MEFSLSSSRSLATTAPLHQGFSRFGLGFLSEISKIHFPQMGRSLTCAAAFAPHSGMAALIPRLTAHHISLMVSLMIQLLFLKSRPSALHPPPSRGEDLAPGTRSPRGGDALRSRRGAQGGGMYSVVRGEPGAHLRLELQRRPGVRLLNFPTQTGDEPGLS